MPTMHEPARHGHLVGHPSQGALGGRLIDAGDLEHDRARLDDGDPVFRLAFALTHTRFKRLARHRFVREDPDKHTTFAAKEVAACHTTGLNLPRGNPRRLERLETIFAERDVIAARRVALHLSALAFAVSNPLGHHWHKTPRSLSKESLLADCFLPAESSRLAPASPNWAAGPHIRFQNFFAVQTAIDPGLHADRSEGREGDGISIAH